MKLDPKNAGRSEFYNLLTSAIAPRPICFAATRSADGVLNVSPFSYFNVFSANPPVVVFSPARRGRNNTTKDTLNNLMEVKECTVNIVNFSMVEQMSLASTEYPPGVSEFEKAGFTPVESERISVPRVGESPVSFECVADDIIPLGDKGGAGNLVLARIVLAHVDNRYLDEDGQLDTTKLDLVARMGGNYYCRAKGDAIFEIPKPTGKLGIGIDRLPESVRMSEVLSGNNLGRLGTVERLPDPSEVAEMAEEAQIEAILEQEGLTPAYQRSAIHQVAKHWLENGETERALRGLLLADGL